MQEDDGRLHGFRAEFSQGVNNILHIWFVPNMFRSALVFANSSSSVLLGPDAAPSGRATVTVQFFKGPFTYDVRTLGKGVGPKEDVVREVARISLVPFGAAW